MPEFYQFWSVMYAILGLLLMLPMTTIGNGFEVIDARDFAPNDRPYLARDFGDVQRISIHHSAGAEPQTYEEELAEIQKIGMFHIMGRGWNGYAYHWTLAPSGRTYYTGDISTTRYIVGADNPFNVGVCLLGNFTDHHPTPEALEALRLLIGEIQFERGKAIPFFGHRDTPGADPTACPGDAFAPLLSNLVSETVSETTPGQVLAEQFPIPGYPDAQDNWPRLLELTEGKQYRLDRALTYLSLMVQESGGREGTVADGGRSIGLFGLHEAGAGAGLSRAERMDPEVQYRVFIPQIDAAFDWAVAQGYRGEDLVAVTGGRAERPYDNPRDPYDGPYLYGKRYREIVAAINWADRLELATTPPPEEEDVDKDALILQLGAIWGLSGQLEGRRPSKAVLARIAAEIKAAVGAAKDAARL